MGATWPGTAGQLGAERPWPSVRREAGVPVLHAQDTGVCQQRASSKEIPALEEEAAPANISHAVPGLLTYRNCEIVNRCCFRKCVYVWCVYGESDGDVRRRKAGERNERNP